MGLFTKTKKEEIKKDDKSPSLSGADLKSDRKKKTDAPYTKITFSDVIISPRVTEKSSWSAEKNAYVFNINPASNKKQVAQAIKEIYGVTPVKVNITSIPSKKVFSRGVSGTKSGGKKAIVYLKKGNKIEII